MRACDFFESLSQMFFTEYRSADDRMCFDLFYAQNLDLNFIAATTRDLTVQQLPTVCQLAYQFALSDYVTGGSSSKMV